MAIGRMQGFDAYKEALNRVAVNYPQTEEGVKARQLITTALPQLENKDFKLSEPQENVKLLYSFGAGEIKEALALKEKITEAIAEVNYNEYTTSIDIYIPDTIFVMVHGIKNPDLAAGFSELLRVNKKFNIQTEPVIISSDNYRVVQLHKNLDSYLVQINKQNP